MNANELPEIGSPLAGGFYAGMLDCNGERFALIVSPADAGTTEGIWGAGGETIEASHVADGPANTVAMAEAGSDIAKWALELSIGEHADWYIPARDELELIYRHLKPTTQENWASFRDGDNPSSIPPGLPYTEEAPTQTTVTEFQEDGEQALPVAWHWTSTQYSAHTARIQDFSDGSQTNRNKGYRHRVRAVRRFKVNH